MKNAEFPKNPGRVLTKALQLGLTAVAYLARTRVTKTTRHLYWGGKGRKGIRHILKEGLSEYRQSVRERRPDAKYLQRIENNVRRSHNKIVLNASVRYGNVEEKRRRRNEDRKYINILADYYGAKIRNIGAVEFSFPEPMLMEASDGSKKRVYPGNTRVPEYVPTHTAPELDFMDMIRGYGIELARQCMRYSVPMREAKRYLDRLINRLMPYLEYVYTEGKRGKKGFIHGGAQELREIVREIQALYGGMNGRPPSITGEVSGYRQVETSKMPDALDVSIPDEFFQSSLVEDDESREADVLDPKDKSEDELDTFFSDIISKCDVNLHPEWKPHVEKIQSLIDERILTRTDAENVLQKLLEDSRMMGSAFHDFIANSEFSVRPFSLFAPIRHGDQMVTEETPFLFTCEVTIANGRGRVDILVFRKKNLEKADESKEDTIWEPFILIEVKTKCFYQLDLYATTTRSKDKSCRVIEPVIERRKSDDSEWEEVINSTPDDYGKDQLKAYEKEVLSAYNRFARSDSNPPDRLMKGVLIVDLKENWETLRTCIRDFILEAYHKYQNDGDSERQFFFPIFEGSSPRMGLVLYSGCNTRDATLVERVQEFNPVLYSRQRDDDREFILYLTVSGKGSPSASAAGIAARWHGLSFIHERVKGKHRDVVWFDLSGELKNRTLRKQSFRAGLQSKSVQRFLRERITFADVSESFSSYANGMRALNAMIEEIDENLKNKSKPFIVVTGMDRIRATIQRQRLPLLDEFLSWILEGLPSHSTLLWFDSPVPVSKTSQKYDTRCVAPFYPNSPWVRFVDEVVYNLPMAPRRYGSYVPVEDDIRWLAIESINSIQIDSVLIPPLYKWGERFRPDSNREENIDSRQEFYLRGNYASIRQGYRTHYSESDQNEILELVPHLRRFYQTYEREERNITIQQRKLPTTISNAPSLLSRIVFRPYQYLTSVDADDRIKKLDPLAKVNHAREYRTTRLFERSPKQTTRPPHIGLLHFQGLDRLAIVRKELSGIRRTSKIITKRYGENKEWKEFLDSLASLTERKVIDEYSENDTFNVLREIRVFLETHDFSNRLWVALKKQRSWIPEGLLEDQKTELKKLLDKDPDLLLIFGNHLFLLLLTSLYESRTLDVPTNSLETLWHYLLPFQLMGIGFVARYHSYHNTGVSILHRSKLIDRMKTRYESLKQVFGEEQVSEVLFGRVCLVEEHDNESPQHILLAFQTRPNSLEMNVIYLKLPHEISGSTYEVLRSFCKDRPFWGASDLILLRELSERVEPERGIDIMIATQRGIRGLWVHDDKTQTWQPIGRVDYYTRKHEAVTLLMSMILREDPTLIQVARATVREPPGNLEDSIRVGLGLISTVYRDVVHVKCCVHLESDTRMFRLSIMDLDSEDEIAHLMISDAVDVLELLRRPDFSCEPVVIDGNHYVWNRFSDIEFDEETKILRPFVVRQDPFKTKSILFPPTAESFHEIEKSTSLKVKISHDYHVCPLRNRNLGAITKQSDATEKIVEYLEDTDGPPGQPESLFNESIFRHGSCWSISFHPDDQAPKEIKELEEIKFTGPILATFLETGAISYRTQDDQWVVHDILIPESKNLPKEFRESIYLMRWRRERAAYPGLYLLEGWSPEISIFEERVEFRLVSELTPQKKVHTVFRPRVEMIERNHLYQLLKEGMEVVLDQAGFSDNTLMKQLVEEEIRNHLSLIEERPTTKLQLESVDIATDNAGGKVVEAIFVTDEGEYVSIQVTQWIHVYQNWTEMAGGIGADVIEGEVENALDGRGIGIELINRIIEDVKDILMEKGVVILES